MTMRRGLPAVAAVVALAAALQADPRPGLPAPPAAPPAQFEHALTPQAGAWVVCAASFMGPDAHELARQTATYLRTQHRLNAYVFDFGEAERKKQQEEWDRVYNPDPDTQGRKKTVNIPPSCVVMVGGFADMDGAKAAAARIKKLPAPKLSLGAGKGYLDKKKVYEPDPDKKGFMVTEREVNPFEMAMPSPNPTVAKGPRPANDAPKADPFLKKLNAEEDYSLLKNPAKYTLAVSDYAGITTVKQQSESTPFLERLIFGNSKGEAMSASAMQAHEVARVLRKLNFQAYVLHTRSSSIVTVGGFTGQDDPAMKRTVEQLKTLEKSALNLYPHPLPMEIPRPQ